MARIGDKVRILDDEKLVMALQKRIECWNDNILQLLGRSGTVVKVDSDGDPFIQFKNIKGLPKNYTCLFDQRCCKAKNVTKVARAMEVAAPYIERVIIFAGAVVENLS